MSRYGSEYRHVATANIFEGSFQDTRDLESGSKVVEAAKDKASGTAARAKSRGSAGAPHNTETFNFKQPPENQEFNPRTYDFKPTSRNLLDCGNFEPEPTKATRKIVPQKEEKPKNKTKRVNGAANSSEGIMSAIKPDGTAAPAHDKLQGYSPRRGGRQYPWHPENQESMSKVGAPMRITDDKPYRSTKRRQGGEPGKTDPWNQGKIQEPKQPDVERRHKCRPANERKLHSFEAEKKEPKFPGYKVTSPWGTDAQ